MDMLEKNLILGYLFTVLNYGFYCASRFCKKKEQMLLLDLMSKLAFVVGLVFMGSLSGAYSMIVNFVYIIFANIKERKQYKWPVLFWLFQLLLVAVLLISFDGISSILVFATVSVNLVAVWWLPPQKMRAVGLVCNVFTLLYHVSLQNWAGACELIVAASNLVSLLKYRRQKAQ